jgi:hypothetical protein
LTAGYVMYIMVFKYMMDAQSEEFPKGLVGLTEPARMPLVQCPVFL